MNDLDWGELRSFYLVAKHGSYSAAARAEKVSQPTLSRHVSRLEERLGVRLFERSVAGVRLTQAGTELYEQVSAMALATAGIQQIGEQASESLNGTVRITSSRIVANYLLPPILAELGTIEPGIEIELVSSDGTENLHYREADIAIRMYRPEQLDVITRKVADLELGIYASHDYLKRKGMPTDVEAFLEHDFVGYDRSPLIIDGFHRMGFDVKRDFFRFRSDDQVACWQMVVAGLGIGFNQCVIGDREKRVERIRLPLDILPLPVWLTAHAALKTDPRIRRVYDFLASKLGELDVVQ